MKDEERLAEQKRKELKLKIAQERQKQVQKAERLDKKPMGFMQSCCDFIIYFIYSL